MTCRCECPLCNGMTHNELFEEYRELVEKHGCAMVGVFRNPDTESPAFTYSMGFAQFGLPDVIIIGNLPQKAVAITINMLLYQWREEGEKLGINDQLLEGLDMNLIPIETNEELYSNYVVNTIQFYHRYPEFNPSGELPRFVQMVWPDKEGRFPGQDGYDQSRYTQPLLTQTQGMVQ